MWYCLKYNDPALFAFTQTCWGWWRPPRRHGSWSKPPCCSPAQPGRAAGLLLCRHRKNSPPRSRRSLWAGHWWKEWETRTRTRTRRNSGLSCAPPAGGGFLESDPRTRPGRPKHLEKDEQHLKDSEFLKCAWLGSNSVCFPAHQWFDGWSNLAASSHRRPLGARKPPLL